MELRRLRYLIVAAEEGNITRAARRLKLAQPALSRQIHALEQELGVQLFDRTGRAARLNPAGEAAVGCARKIVAQLDEAFERARLASRGAAGLCIVTAGVIPIWSGFVAQLVAHVRDELPEVDLVVEESAGHDQWRALRSHTADIGLGIEPLAEYTELSSEPQWVDVIDRVGVSIYHPFATRSTLHLAELSAERFIWLQEELDYVREALEREFSRRRLPPPSMHLTETVADVGALVGAGQGWTLMPRSGTYRMPYGVTAIPIEGFAMPITFSRLWCRGDTRKVVLTVLDLMHDLSYPKARDSSAKRRLTPPAGSAEIPSPIASRIELRQLRYFRAVIEEGSIGRAARRLDLTQPALSRQLAALERVAGTRLLDRAARGVHPTAAGESLYADAGSVLELAENVAPEVLRAHRGMTGMCILASVPTSAVSAIVSHAIADCASRHPELRIAVRTVPMPLQMASVRLGRIDLGIAHVSPAAAPYDEDAERTLVADDALDSALIAADHPLARKPSVRLSELADVPFLFMGREFDSALYDLVMNALAERDYRPHIDATFSGLETRWTVAAEGRGWTLGAHSQRSRPPRGLVAIPLSDFSLPWGIEIVGRLRDDRAPVVAVREALERAGRNLTDRDVMAAGAPLGSAAGVYQTSISTPTPAS